MIKLSIIVPIYGVEQYLRKCVDSLLSQDLGNYEIILVDDGSPDSCPQICDSYAEAYENIRVLHRENGGLSAARNSGIEVAQGEYVMFIDSDDYIEPNVLGGLLAQVEREELDVLRYNYQNVRIAKREELRGKSEYEVFEPNKDPKRDVDYSESVVDGETFLNERLGPACYAWQFIIRQSLIAKCEELIGKSDGCLFKEGIYFEDTEWTPRMLMRAKRVASTPVIAYNYLWREGSITLPDNPQKRKKVIDDKIALIRGFKDQSKKVKDPKWYTWMTSFIAMTVLDAIKVLTIAECKAYIKELQSIQIFPLTTAREKKWTHKLKVQLANISPMLYCKIMNMNYKLRAKR